MDENHGPSAAVPPGGHPSFLFLAVLFVKDGYSEGIQKKLRSILEAGPVLAQILLRLDGVPLESITQLSPTVRLCSGRHPETPNIARLGRAGTSLWLTTQLRADKHSPGEQTRLSESLRALLLPSGA